MQDSGTFSQSGNLENCIDTISHRIVSLEARLLGPLPGLSPNSPSTQKNDQQSIEKVLENPKSSKVMIIGTPSSKSLSNENSAHNSPGETKKRNRNEDLPRKKGNFSGTKRRQTDDPVDSDYSQNVVSELPIAASDVSELFKTDTEFMMPSLVNSLNQKIAKLQQELKTTENNQVEFDKKLATKDTLIENLKHQLEKKDEEMKFLFEENKKISLSAEKGKNALIKSLRAYEEKKRQELKVKLFNDSFRLGKVITIRESSKFQEY